MGGKPSAIIALENLASEAAYLLPDNRRVYVIVAWKRIMPVAGMRYTASVNIKGFLPRRVCPDREFFSKIVPAASIRFPPMLVVDNKENI